MNYEDCKSCNKPFRLTEYTMSMPGTKEREEIICPYCNSVVSKRISNGTWTSHKLDEKEESDYRKMNKEKG